MIPILDFGFLWRMMRFARREFGLGNRADERKRCHSAQSKI